MPQGDAEKALLNYVAALNARDYPAAAELFAPDAKIWISGMEFEAAQLQAMLEAIPGLFATGPRLDVFNSFGETNRAVAEMDVSGRTQNGKEYRNRYVIVVDMVDGKVSRLSEYLDRGPLETALS